MHRIAREVRERVVHPAHVPLHAEAEPAHVGRARHHRPRRRLLGDRSACRGARGRRVSLSCRRSATASRFSWPPCSLGIHSPGLRAVVEVEHRRDAVDAQAVDVELVEPEQRARDQEAAHLVAAVVEDRGLPVGVKALPRDRRARTDACRRSRPRPCSSRGKCAGTQSRITPMPRWCSVSIRNMKSCGVP